VAIAQASVTYNMIVEGTLAETGYHAYNKVLVDHGIMPGMQEVTHNLNLDESRHIAFGVYLLSRLTAEFGDDVWEAIEEQMNKMLPLALGMIDETLSHYDELPFGITLDEFLGYATVQFQKRYARIEKAREQSVADIMGSAA
jgi:ribonucleoside-diphosphate reductase beta chain